MINKKVVFTTLSLPLAGLTFWAHNWQKERKQWKIQEIEIRQSKLRQPLHNFSISDLKQTDLDSEEFKQIWLYRPVKIEGVFDHEKEEFVQRTRGGEKGVEIITPFYTNVTNEGELEGLMVHRGWIKEDLKDLKAHWTKGDR